MTIPKTNFSPNEEKPYLKIFYKYKTLYNQWSAIFNKHNVKVCFNWQRFYSEHIVMKDAINDLGGINAIWQLAFNGVPYWDSQAQSDIFFGYSNFCINNEINNKSIAKYFIISGLPNDYITQHNYDEAYSIRNELYKKGVKKIVSVFDENAGEDHRWHTGYELQQENYSKILMEMMKNKELGVIFKPKSPKFLKKRLGPVYSLLEEGIKTGRCKLLDIMNRNVSGIPTILAGLASDLVIHTDLSAGTAAIECAAIGKPVLLINRENCLYSKLNELPLNTVRFNNWDDTILAIKEFKIGKINNRIGNWGEFINYMDPFRDGLSAKRIGTYLKWIIEGYDKGIKSDSIMSLAAEKYIKKWGKDKIIYF